MPETVKADLCVLGAGSGGLSVAAGAAQMGASTVLIEAGRMGGDCLNYGCVPSKSLIAAAKAAEAVRRAGRFGVNGHEPAIDHARVNDHVRAVIAAIEPHDSQERFEGLGVRVIRAHGRFTGPREVEAGGVRVQARRFVVATGSRPMVPPIPGLDEVPYFTNETIFDNRAAIDHLVVIGGGPIGCELAQAHRRLGSRVTVVDMGPVLPKDDPELTAVVRASLIEDGIGLEEKVAVTGAMRHANGIAITIRTDDGERRIEGSHLLVAAGREANVEDLGLDAAGVEHDRKGIRVDARLRSSNRKVFAIGDVAGGLQFTHVANHHAGIVIKNALFRLPAKADTSAVPWVTYTDPELAHVGLGEAQARAAGWKIEVLRARFEDNDRARAEGECRGMIKVVSGPRGRVLGATIVGAHAGELVMPWVLAIQNKLRLGAIAGAVAPYPTLSEIGKRAAGSYFTERLFTPRTRAIVRFLARFG